MTAPGDPEEAARHARRRFARLQLVMGVPALIVSVFGLVLAYRLAERPLGDAAFWGFLGAIGVVFGAYFGHALLSLRKTPSPRPD
ncbi:MAG: hypothetical protein Kow0092_08790 [Deferrisomatales bacterium]